ncbi:hypothetical protein [Antrihabitans sp. YC2-6]|uniref:hypothetical protein n=1 Tax=Antrihabitans sp. YC2-6 TaxID=2799498 RepID=UPI001F47F376|nr:hypothetical protein [Antrihabitans sp. YC2-6]
MVSTTANGITLITDDVVCGVEVPAELAEGVHAFMRANNLTGPVVELPGAERRQIHLLTGVRKASMAITALKAAGAIVHMDGAGIPLPPTQLSAGSARWAISPDEVRWVPPVVALGAAVRAIRTARPAQRPAAVAC